MRKYLIYLYQFENGKIYIGQTYVGSARLSRINEYRGQKVYEVLKLKTHQTIILENNLSKEEADEKEIYYIKKYNATNPEIGYNIALGGHKGCELTKEQLEKARQNGLSGSNPLMTDQYTSDGEFIKTWPSRSDIDRFYGWKRGTVSKAFKQKNPQYTVKGFVFKDHQEPAPQTIEVHKNIYITTPVEQYDANYKLIAKFPSMSIAHQITGISVSSISSVLNNRIKTAGGFFWKKAKK